MEHPQIPDINYHSNVDTSRPFRSVKEAVAIFGDRILLPEVHVPKTFSFPKKETPVYLSNPAGDNGDVLHSGPSTPQAFTHHSHNELSDTVQKLELELEVTKADMKLMKEKELEMEVALASLNAELHKNMSKLALAEATAMAAKNTTGTRETINKEEKKRDAYLRMDSRGPSRNLAQILSIGEKDGLLLEKKKQRKALVKKKPIIPLVAELFARKKGTSSPSLNNNLLHLNLN